MLDIAGIFWVAAPCSSIAEDIALVISEIRPMVDEIILIEPTASWFVVCMPAIDGIQSRSSTIREIHREPGTGHGCG